MRTAQDSLLSIKLYAETVEAHRILRNLLLDLRLEDEAIQHVTEGRAMAEKSGMKGEPKRYHKLLARMQ